MKGNFIFGLFAVFFLSSFVSPVQAASLYMDPNTAELYRGDTLKVSIRLDTDEDECINVVDGVVTYSDNIQPVDISRGSSILSMWVEEPVINRADHTITFAGGIPNGYCGRIAGDPRLTNVVVDLLFQSPGFVIGATDDGNVAKIAFSPQTQVYLNDGLGTQAPLSMYGASITLNEKAGGNIDNQWSDIINADNIAPNEFSITLERTANAYSNDWFIVFNTTDKQSGVDHYEVIEESTVEARLFNWGREDAPWREVKSPYVLKDQSLNSTIRVRAIDKAGNEYIAVYVPEEGQRAATSETKIMIALIVAVGFAFVLSAIVYTIMVVRRKKRKDTDGTEDEDGDEEDVEDEQEEDTDEEDEV